ncbi:response regulator transcription factor [Pontibacterium sp.]|uniref:response regulator transcription factor n=1 Tax=Pontibacterium sp. TaxID=2036026 RepID=UPI0035165D67
MHVFVSQKPLSPVRWHQAFPDAITVRTPDEASAVARGKGCVWLDFTCLKPVDRQLWLEQAKALKCPVVVLSNVPNDDEAVHVFSAGACGYCHVLAAAQQLQEVALVVEHGGYWVGSSFIEKVLQLSADKLSQVPAPEECPYSELLTEREMMVAREVARGATNKEIASSLEITERTVKAHLASIFAKTGARDRIQLVLRLNHIASSTV